MECVPSAGPYIRPHLAIPQRIHSSTIMKPFEKWDLNFRREYLERFADAYNVEHNTTFAVGQDSFVDSQDYDFRLFTNADVLKVQHTAQGVEPQKEYVRPKRVSFVVDRLRSALSRYANCLLIINFISIPNSQADLSDVTNKVEMLVLDKLSCGETTVVFDERALGSLNTYIDKLELRPIINPKVAFMWSSFDPANAAMLGDDQRFEMAVGNKQNHYADVSDIVLIVEYEVMPPSDIYIQWIREQQARRPFRGLWIHDGWHKQFICIK